MFIKELHTLSPFRGGKNLIEQIIQGPAKNIIKKMSYKDLKNLRLSHRGMNMICRKYTKNLVAHYNEKATDLYLEDKYSNFLASLVCLKMEADCLTRGLNSFPQAQLKKVMENPDNSNNLLDELPLYEENISESSEKGENILDVQKQLPDLLDFPVDQPLELSLKPKKPFSEPLETNALDGHKQLPDPLDFLIGQFLDLPSEYKKSDLAGQIQAFIDKQREEFFLPVYQGLISDLSHLVKNRERSKVAKSLLEKRATYYLCLLSFKTKGNLDLFTTMFTPQGLNLSHQNDPLMKRNPLWAYIQDQIPDISKVKQPIILKCDDPKKREWARQIGRKLYSESL